MKSFFVSLLYAAIIGGIGAALVGKPYRKQLRAVSALLCTAIAVSPLLGTLPDLEAELTYRGDYSAEATAYLEPVEKQLCSDAESAVCDYIFSETGIKPLDLSISFESVDGYLTVTAVRVRVQSEKQAEAVREAISRGIGGDYDLEVELEA